MSRNVETERKLRKRGGTTLVRGGETFGQSFRAVIPVPFETGTKSIFCALSEVCRPTLEEHS